jgi:hypothetical protein|tara:strand:+ start:160 stop:855 length:696 start_codon:yes stop_codon:yes gene_type:complete
MITDFDIFQPWSTFVLGTTLPSEVLERMIKLTDEIIEDRAGTSDDTGAAQIEDEFLIDLEKFAQEEVQSFEFLMEACGTYVIQAYCQSQPFNKEYIMNEQWLTKLTSMWVVSQKDNEYNPIHVHEECHLSAVMYLKIPEYLPNRKTGNRALDDGALTFTSNVSKDPIWGIPNMTISPKVGQFFIFPASQQHCVYPFKTSDGKGERRCISFNTIFANKTELDRIEKEKGEKI